jgi:hypothetical protein
MNPAKQFAASLIAAMIFAAFTYTPKILCMATADRYRNISWSRERFRLSYLISLSGFLAIVFGLYLVYFGKSASHGIFLVIAIGCGACVLGVGLMCWKFRAYVEVNGNQVVFRSEWKFERFEMTDITGLQTNWSNIVVTLKNGSIIRLPMQLHDCGKLLAILRCGKERRS